MDAPYDPAAAKASSFHRPGWKVEEDTELYEENVDDHVQHLPHHCRCVEQVLNRTALAAFCHSEANGRPINFTGVVSATPGNLIAPRPGPTTPSSTTASAFDVAFGNDDRSGGGNSPRALGGGAVSSRAPADYSQASPTADFYAEPLVPSPATTAPELPVPHRFSGKPDSRRVSVSDNVERAVLAMDTPEASDALPWAVPQSPFSAGSSLVSFPSFPAAESAELLEKDEHDRAIAAFLRENGFTKLTRPRRQSLVGSAYPLHCAASQGLVRMTELLIKAGAPPSQKNSWGQTALDVATRRNRKGSHAGVLTVLRQATAAAAA